MRKLSEEEKAKENYLRGKFLALPPKEQGDVYSRLRRRIMHYRELQTFAEAQAIVELARELDLNALQIGRLQSIVRRGDKRLREAIKEFDAQSPALHPLDREEHIPQDDG